ncbi:methyltransferase domain-containing protein [Micromonospora sp. WMMD1120]|uniref:methyltransferase domain-containing protein n=1 Tax=Micromonospora sp. WMMD1120 TaxID=3016106 RepID=UPI0024160F18|nr:methyltransferase domain-containing protein [Micromonospora sp. WMMD1120]MDG4810917.1 methyltransferase domain-containing protein [Micromonospora sp. WMMD1120]
MITLDDFDLALGGPDGCPAEHDGRGGPFGRSTRPAPGHWLVHDDGRRDPLPVRRWHGPAEPVIEAVAARCDGPTIDLGCGPGRLTEALARRGLVALGVDRSAEAVRLTRSRGVVALRRDILAPLPGEGRWAHAMLVDGNIGIGGDPVRLLRRCGALIAPDGTLVVEVDSPGTGLWQGRAYVLSGSPGVRQRRGPAFRWARVGAETVARVAAAADLRVARTSRSGARCFAELVRS